MNKQSSKDNFIMAGILTVQFTVKAPVPGVGVCSLIFINGQALTLPGFLGGSSQTCFYEFQI